MTDATNFPEPLFSQAVQPLAQLAAGGKWRLELPHNVPWHRFLWITRGTGSVMINGRLRAMSGSVAIFVPANTLHAIQLPTGTFGTVVSLTPNPDLPLPDGPRFIRVTDVKIQQTVNNLFDNLIHEIETQVRPSDVAKAAHAALLGVWMDRNVMPQDMRRPNAAERLMQAFSVALVNGYHTGDTAGAYAKRFGVTATHLSRCCNTAIGLPASVLLQFRVQHEARRLLVDTDLAINKISSGLGFSSPAYFTRSFQQHAKTSPSAFRHSNGDGLTNVSHTTTSTGPRLTVNLHR